MNGGPTEQIKPHLNWTTNTLIYYTLNMENLTIPCFANDDVKAFKCLEAGVVGGKDPNIWVV
jgi:hypothetical protein